MQDAVINNLYMILPEVVSNSAVTRVIKDIKVLGINAYKKTNNLEILISSEQLISTPLLAEIERELAASLEFKHIRIKVKFDVSFPLKEVLEKYMDSIIFKVNQEVALSRGILDDCNWDINEDKLVIGLKTKGEKILVSRKCNRIIESMLHEYFGFKIKVEFMDITMDEFKKEEYIEYKESQERRIVRSQEKLKKENNTSQQENIQYVIHGKDFNNAIIRMVDINQDLGEVAVCGDVFRVEFREIRGGKYLFIFDVTDYTSSLTVKLFIGKDSYYSKKEQIIENISVRIRGDVQYDKFSREIVLFAKDIIKFDKKTKLDTAENKRVELHLHTQMSSMDAVTPVEDLVKRAAQWGHKAVAITDHGVVQAYPEAYNSAKKNNIKLIYGVECYLLDDDIPIIYNVCGQSINGEIIVVDIETTGLDAQKDKITEIGAVKISNGKIVDEFHSFVNPEIPIPGFIVKLTGITDIMVQDAPTIDTVLPKFFKFVRDLPLAAHNAPFDMSFLRHNAKKTGAKIDNTVIDTLELCRKLFPELERHKLNLVAKHLGIKNENYHRAIDDAKTTAIILVKCLEMLKDRDVKTVDGINREFDSCTNLNKVKAHHAVILVKDYIGLKNLYKIISYSHLKYFYKKPRVPRKLLMENCEGLLLGTACESGELYTAIINNVRDKDLLKIARFYHYLEIQPLGNNNFLINNGKVRSREQLKNINKKIVDLGEKLKKPVVATCDVHFIDERDEVFRRILMSGQGYHDADNQAPLYFRTTNEMLEEFKYLGHQKAYEVVVTNTNIIADMIQDIIPIPEGTFPPNIEGSEEEVERLARVRAEEIYGEHLPPVVASQMSKELESIIKNGFSVMYVIAQKLVSKAIKDGYLVGSRGSVGSSFVANLVGITEVNSLPPHYICGKCKHSEFITDGSVGCGFDLPDKKCSNCGELLKKEGYDIPFESFLGFDGDKEPDIDLNFSGEYQPIAHKYTEELFGKGHVYRAGTISTIAEKTAYGFVKNYMEEKGIVVTNAEINRLVKGCSGIKKTTGQHPGGVIIVPQDKEIFEFCPIQRPANDASSNIITTHFDYHSISGRLLKLDVLGHDDPTVIKMLEDLTGVKATSIPIGEKKTMGIFKSTEPLNIKPKDIDSEVGTFGIPEFGTRFVRQMLVDTKPTTFAELIRISGLSHGTDVWLNNAQELVKSGTAKLSEVICTRDDIMLYLLHSGLDPKTAFKIMEDVRKGKGLKEEYEDEMKKKKVPSWYIQSCKKIKYMFPKAHAAAYVMMAFRIAWFKVYYPEAFYVAYFTVRADDFDADLMTHGQDKVKNKIKEIEKKGNDITQKEKSILTILEVANEMYARGINFRPVDLYKSDPVKFLITDEGIRPPLNSLQGLGATAAQNIMEARQNGEFLSIDELKIKAKISKSVIEILEQHGCLEGMQESNQISMF